MKTSLLRLLNCLLPGVLLLSACASDRSDAPSPTPQAPAGNAIGVLNLVPDEYIHVHIGTTAFNNFIHRPPSFQRLSNELTRTVTAALQASTGQPVVELYAAPAVLQAAQDDALTSFFYMAVPTIKPGLQAAFDEARRNARAGRVIVISPRARVGERTNGMQVKGMGAYTRSLVGLDSEYAMLTASYAVVEPGSYDLRELPNGGLERFDPLNISFQEIDGFDWPDHVDARAPFDTARVLPALRQLMQLQARNIAASLQAMEE